MPVAVHLSSTLSPIFTEILSGVADTTSGEWPILDIMLLCTFVGVEHTYKKSS